MGLCNLPRTFYARDARVVAPDLLGKILFTCSRGVVTAGLIVETEAYLGLEDPASHAFRGKTPRNAMMFGAGGLAYVYFTYGVHHCMNVVTGAKGTAGAVLIRALEPLEGIPTMQRRRKQMNLQSLTSGPGKLCQAMGIHRSFNGLSLNSSRIWMMSQKHAAHIPHQSSTRIGIREGQDLPYRFFVPDSPYVSKTR